MITNISKSEIETAIKGKGDFVQIDYLMKFLKEKLALDVKKFVYQKLAEIYERKSMYNEVAKMFDNIALLSVSNAEKIYHYLNETKFFIKAGYFDRADEAMKKALSESNSPQKKEVYSAVKEFYNEQANIYLKQLKRGNAARVYEKLLEMNISDEERKEIKKKLLELYEKLGRLREYFSLKKS